MFVRNVAIHLKANALGEFTRLFDNEVLPILRKQPGFRDEITFSTTPTGVDVNAISLWDTREQAEAYNATGYPEVLKRLNKVLDGSPRVRVSNVISSTLHKTAAIAAWAACQVSSGRQQPPRFLLISHEFSYENSRLERIVSGRSVRA